MATAADRGKRSVNLTGRTTAQSCLERHFAMLGIRSSLEIPKIFASTGKMAS